MRRKIIPAREKTPEHPESEEKEIRENSRDASAEAAETAEEKTPEEAGADETTTDEANGEKSGAAAMEPEGEMTGETAGEPAGERTGETAGEPAGERTGETAEKAPEKPERTGKPSDGKRKHRRNRRRKKRMSPTERKAREESRFRFRPQDSGRRKETKHRKERKKLSRRAKRILKLVLLLVILLIVVLLLIPVVYENRLIRRTRKVEAWTTVKAEDFVDYSKSSGFCNGLYKAAGRNIKHPKFQGKVEKTVTPGTHHYRVKVCFLTENVTLKAKDTKAPKLKTKAVTLNYGQKAKAKDFVEKVTDGDPKVKVSFASKPDYEVNGDQEVTISAKDSSGNATKEKAMLTIIHDTEPPKISGQNISTTIGKAISYKKYFSATDDHDGDVKVDVDSSGVNINQAGDYTVTVTATDAAGNTASEKFRVTVEEQATGEDLMNKLCDKALSGIIKDGMSQREKATAIFWYIRGHVSYVSTSDKSSWVNAAITALQTGRGDCFNFYAVARALLTRAGIKNMPIERIPEGDLMHYWNLVDIGDGHGWYHYDTTPRVNNPTPLLWTDEQAMAYSKNNKNCYNYDRSKYPEIP